MANSGSPRAAAAAVVVAAAAAPKGEVDGHQIQHVRRSCLKPHGFAVHTPSRTFCFFAEDEAQQRGWIAFLTGVLRRLQLVRQAGQEFAAFPMDGRRPSQRPTLNKRASA
jgi:hypothetical protein